MAYNPILNPHPILQNGVTYLFSTVNTSAVQLAAAATFNGTVEDVTKYPAISILLFSDQNMTLTINEYVDAGGTKLVNSTVITYLANGQMSRSFTINGNYIKVTCTNNGGSTTTTFVLDTAYGVIDAATQLKNAPIALNEVNGTAITMGQKTSALSIPVVPSSDDFITGQSAQTATVNNILTAASGTAATDVSAYRAFTCQVVSTGTAGTFIFEGSNDNVNFQSIPVYNQALLVRVPIITAITATVSQFIYEGSSNFKFLRLRIATTVTGGSIQAFTNYLQTALGTTNQVISNGTAANLLTTVSGTVTANGNAGTAAHSAATSGNPVYVAGKVAPITIATVDATLVAGDASGVPVTTGQQVITKNFGTSELDFTFLVNPSVTTTTIQPLVLASGTANIRNYIASLILQTDTIGAAGSMFIVDGQGAIGTSVTIATPGVFTSTAHDLKVGDCIMFTSIGTITGIAVNTQYWVTATSFAATTFTLATSHGGTAIQITGSTSAFTFYRVLQLVRIPTTAFTTPIVFNYKTPIRSIANGALNVLIPTSLTSGAIYLTADGYRGF